MINIDSVKILNFKSIKECFFSFKNISINNVNSGILVGLNESGKSSFLEAISLINKGFDDVNYEEYCFLDAQDEDKYLEMYVTYDITNMNELRKELQKSKGLCAEIIQELELKSIENNIYINKENGSDSILSLEYNKIDVSKYVFEVRTYRNVKGAIINIKSISIKKSTGDLNDSEQVTEDSLEEYMKEFFSEIFNRIRPEIIIWRSSKEYLINDVIDLKGFIVDPNKVSIPLKNIFNIYGRSTIKDITNSIENALKSHAKRDMLVDSLSNAITKYVNKIWKEHKIKVRVSIDGGMCDVMIEDTDKKYSYFNMDQRSDGFKQFFSLILSLSTLNESSELRNKIILIDEPEVHLHPSGIQYMRDEILKIAQNNTVIVATHSQFMIDVNCPERHFIVSKQKGVTSIKQVDDSTNFKDDSVLKSAFGLNLYKELLPQKIIVVEGGDDKCFLDHCLAIYSVNSSFSIKAAGGASKIPGFASLLSGELLSPSILFDADKEGMDCRKKVLDNIKTDFTKDNVFLLTDVCSELPKNSTIEDLYPLDFINKELVDKMSSNTVLESGVGILEQLSKDEVWSKLDKQQKDSSKVKLSKSFLENYKTKESLDSIPRLKLFIENFIDKMNL